MKRFVWQHHRQVSQNTPLNTRNWLAPLLTIGLIISSLYFLFASQFFTIENIVVESNNFVKSDLIKEKVEQRFDNKRFWFLSESNILAFNEAEAIKSISHPRISEVTIKKTLPDKLVVNISEKESTAIWQHQGRWFEIDADGIVISEIGGPDGNSIVLVDTNRVDPTPPGTKVIEPAAIEFAKTVTANIPRGLGFDLTQFDVANWSNYSVTVSTNESWDLRFSTELNISDQISKLRTFVIQKNQTDENWRNNLSYIDLRFGSSRIYYR